MKIDKESVRNLFRLFWKLIQRKPPVGNGVESQKPWRTFEQIILWRSNIMTLIFLVSYFQDRFSLEQRVEVVDFYCNTPGVRESSMYPCNIERVISLIPVVHTAELTLHLVMIPVFILSCWKIDLCKYHIYVWLLREMIVNFLPADRGNLFLPFFCMNLTFICLTFSWHFWANSFVIFGLLVWQILG